MAVRTQVLKGTKPCPFCGRTPALSIGRVVSIECKPCHVWMMHDGILGELSDKYFGGVTMDLTKVRYKGRLCHMAVDDEGFCKNLPRNEAATKAYLANCHPGTTHHIAGDAVVFGGLLP